MPGLVDVDFATAAEQRDILVALLKFFIGDVVFRVEWRHLGAQGVLHEELFAVCFDDGRLGEPFGKLDQEVVRVLPWLQAFALIPVRCQHTLHLNHGLVLTMVVQRLEDLCGVQNAALRTNQRNCEFLGGKGLIDLDIDCASD